MTTTETVELKNGRFPNQLSMNKSILMDKMEIIEKSVKHIRAVIFVNIICLFLYCGRTSIWISYAETFDNSNSMTIAFIIWIESIILAIIGFLFCIFGQRIGFDKTISLLLLIISMGCIIESIANNFITLTIGYLISQISFIMIYISISYISWLLPFNYSITYISYNYAWIALFSLSGPIFTSFISYYISYRIAFIINAILIFITFIISLIFIFDKQKNIQSQQLEIEQIYEQQIQFEYSSNSKTAKKRKSTTESNMDHTNNHNIIDNKQRFPIFLQKIDIDSFSDKLFDLSISNKLDWYFLFHYIIQIGFIYGSTSIFYIYYTQYVIEKYENGTILIGGLQLFVSAISCSLGCIITRFILFKLTFLFERISIFIALIIQFGIFGFVFIRTFQIYYNFIWCSIIMFITGFLLVQYEKLLLNIMLPQESGRINGIKSIITNIMISIGVLSPGILWNKTIESLWYTLVIINAIMILIEILYTILINGTNQHRMNLKKTQQQQDLNNFNMVQSQSCSPQI